METCIAKIVSEIGAVTFYNIHRKGTALSTTIHANFVIWVLLPIRTLVKTSTAFVEASSTFLSHK